MYLTYYLTYYLIYYLTYYFAIKTVKLNEYKKFINIIIFILRLQLKHLF
jgi:hypothetical protein